MRILEYEYHDPNDTGWIFSKVQLSPINLIVGDSSMGKSRFLNTIFNIGSNVVRQKLNTGFWRIKFVENNRNFLWVMDSIQNEVGEAFIRNEVLSELSKDGTEIEKIVERNSEEFLFRKATLPKLPKNQSSISLLQEEETISDIYLGFRKILRRDFSGSDLSRITSLIAATNDQFSQLIKHANLFEMVRDIHENEFNLNLFLFVLYSQFPDIFNKIADAFKDVFPLTTRFQVFDNLLEVRPDLQVSFPGLTPVLAIKEEGINDWLILPELSSGMKKILLLIADIFSLPEDSIYLIDKYENSLGLSAINYLPTLLFDPETRAQFIITSHHPYIINNIPVENWLVFHRNGNEVKIKFGAELTQRYGTSKQEAFFQLLNDSFYMEGEE